VRAAAAASLALALALGLGAARAAAHPLAPSLLELIEADAGRVQARLTAPRLAAGGVRAEPVLPARCRPLGAPRTRADDARLVTELALDCGAAGLEGAEIGAARLAETRTALIVRVARRDGRTHQALLRAGEDRFRVPAQARSAQVVADYARLAAAHLLGGGDHLLFAAGLFVLLRARPRRLVGALTAFTLGHAATLSWVALGGASPPAALAEVAIAATLVALALELARGGRGLLAAHPGLAAGAFGLIHGLGFAGALREVGLPEDALPLALLSFNAGLELAQLAFLAALAALAALARAGLGAAGAPARPPAGLAAHAIGGLGAFLVLDRVIALVLP
jgi:hypothetical protein